VKTFRCGEVTFDGNASSTVNEVMAQIGGLQRLTFKGVELEAGRTLGSYNVQDNDTLEEMHPIGNLGEAWGPEHKRQWLGTTSRKRSYNDEVVSKIDELRNEFAVVQYGELTYGKLSYSLLAMMSKDWNLAKPCVLVTGGVHGYETSGVHGALLFAKEKAAYYAPYFNVCILPCVSPWGYEHIQRWNPHCHDPNRNFYENTPCQEAALAQSFVMTVLEGSWLVHVDCHETTDSDPAEFIPAMTAHAGKEQDFEAIPDGFYCYDRKDAPNTDFLKAVVDSVRLVTHIAPPDEDNKIMGLEIAQDGVLFVPFHLMNVCCAMTPAKFITTTEVYPDSPKVVTSEECNRAQVAAICGGLDYVLANSLEHLCGEGEKE